MVVVVLGMHRSGTSMLSSMLETLGVNMGEDLLPNHWEDRAFIDLNDRILKAAGGNWYNPPPLEAIKATPINLRAEASALVKSRSIRPLWGWKDPRTCLTLPVYIPYLESPKYIVMWRGKNSIVRSLTNRDGDLHKDPENLVRRYRARVEGYGLPALFVSYESLINSTSARIVLRSIDSWIDGNSRIDDAFGRIQFDNAVQ